MNKHSLFHILIVMFVLWLPLMGPGQDTPHKTIVY